MPARNVALVGNPNTGKSSLFNELTGLHQRTGNFPGVTVDRKVGVATLSSAVKLNLLDLPGTYGLYPKSEDEAITCRVLQEPQDPDHPDAVVVIADATNLRPGILLCTQVIDLGFPTVLVINMADLAPEAGAEAHDRALARSLGVPVVRTSVRKGTGIAELKALLASNLPLPKQRFFRVPEGLNTIVEDVRTRLGFKSDYAAYQRLLVGDYPELAILRHQAGLTQPTELISNELIVRYDRIADILAAEPDEDLDRSERASARLDKILLHPIWGYVVFVGLLMLIFQAIFAWASYPMDLLDGAMATLADGLRTTLPEGWVRDLAVDGIVAGIQGIVVFVPQIALLFFFISLLEESGYMSRAVFLMDRLMRPFGLSGKSVIPLFGGFACAVPSILAVRSIPNRKERLLTILITPLMSCSARIPVYTVLIAVFVPPATVYGLFDLRGLVMAGLYGLGVVVALIVALIFKRILKYNSDGLFVAELPNFRRPRLGNVGRQVYEKASAFVFDAGKVILVLSILLWFLSYNSPPGQHSAVQAKYEALRKATSDTTLVAELNKKEAAEMLQVSYAGYLGRTIEPVIAPLGYDWKIGIALISSFAAREVFVGTMNTLYAMGEGDDEAGYGKLSDRLRSEKRPDGTPLYTSAVALSLLVFYALAMQCMSTLAVIKRETGGWKWATIQLVYQSGIAYLLALITYQVFS